MLATIPIDMIENGQRLRELSEATVTALVNSIGDVGLLNPISVYRRKVIKGADWVDGYGLVAGLHRKRACERLGLVEIEANVLDLDDLDCQIAECDENLCAPQLTPADRARFTKRRQEAYIAKYGKPKGKGAAAANEAMGNDFNATAKLAVAFTDDTAAKTGAAVRTVRRDAERGKDIADKALDLVRGTKLDTGTYLDKLKKLPVTEQIKAVRADLAKPVQVRSVTSKIDGDVKARAAKEVANIIAEYVPGEWWDAVKANLYAAGASNIAHELTNITGQSVMDRGAA